MSKPKKLNRLNHLTLAQEEAYIVVPKSSHFVEHKNLLLDKVSISIATGTWKYGSIKEISRTLNALGYELNKRTPQPFRSAYISFSTKHTKDGVFAYNCYLTFNGFSHLNHFFGRSKTDLAILDNNTLWSLEDYDRVNLLNELKKEIETMICEAKALVFKSAPRWTMKRKMTVNFKHIEVCCDNISTSELNAENYLQEREKFRRHYPEINYGGLKKDGSTRGARVDVSRNIAMSLYKKRDDKILRKEVKFTNKAAATLVKDIEFVSDKIDLFISTAADIFNEVFSQGKMEPIVQPSPIDAFLDIASICGKNTREVIYAINKGVIRIRSSNKPLYNSIRMLHDHGIMVKCTREIATYRVAEKYQIILKSWGDDIQTPAIMIAA